MLHMKSLGFQWVFWIFYQLLIFLKSTSGMTNISLIISPPFDIPYARMHDFRDMIIMHKFVLDHSLKQLNNLKLRGGQSLNRTIFYDLKCLFNNGHITAT